MINIVTAFKILNNLEVNEEFLYGHTSEMEQGPLASQKLVRIQ